MVKPLRPLEVRHLRLTEVSELEAVGEIVLDQAGRRAREMFTDIEGSTRLLKELGRDRYAELLATHNRLLDETFDAAGGIEVDRRKVTVPVGSRSVALLRF